MKFNKCKFCMFAALAEDETNTRCLVCTNFPESKLHKARLFLETPEKIFPIVAKNKSCENWEMGKHLLEA